MKKNFYRAKDVKDVSLEELREKVIGLSIVVGGVEQAKGLRSAPGDVSIVVTVEGLPRPGRRFDSPGQHRMPSASEALRFASHLRYL